MPLGAVCWLHCSDEKQSRTEVSEQVIEFSGTNLLKADVNYDEGTVMESNRTTSNEINFHMAEVHNDETRELLHITARIELSDENVDSENDGKNFDSSEIDIPYVTVHSCIRLPPPSYIS